MAIPKLSQQTLMATLRSDAGDWEADLAAEVSIQNPHTNFRPTYGSITELALLVTVTIWITGTSSWHSSNEGFEAFVRAWPWCLPI